MRNPLPMELDVENLPSGFKLGHYVIKNHVATGGMGIVYKAYEPRLNRFVAIKILSQVFANDPVSVLNFLDEARAVAAISHPNIVPIHFVGNENGCIFFSMPLIEGGTLDDWIERNQFFTVPDAFWFLDQAVAALDAAFHANIVHLDIKPSNFLLNGQKQLFLTDFGLAESLGGDPSLVQSKSGMGTPLYASPEQIKRAPTDQRTDIYCLGATLFHLLVRQPVYPGDTADEVVVGHLCNPFPAEVVRQAGLSEGWVQLLGKMLEKRPDDRFGSYDELSAAIQALRAASLPSNEVAAPKRSDMAASDVYIAHADQDKDAAEYFCECLEGESVRCWLAGRDIEKGASWATSFVLALTNSKVVVVLLSMNANTSPKVQRELEEAVHFGKPIVPVLLENVVLGPEQAFLNDLHPLDAFGQPPSIFFDNLLETIKLSIQELELRKQEREQPPAPPPPPPPAQPYLKPYVRVSILGFIVLYLFILYSLPKTSVNRSGIVPMSQTEVAMITNNIKLINEADNKLAVLPKHKVGHGVCIILDQFYGTSADTLKKGIDLLADAGVDRIDLTPPPAFWGSHFSDLDESLCDYIHKKGMQVRVAPPFDTIEMSSHPANLEEFQRKCCEIDTQIAESLHPNDFFVFSRLNRIQQFVKLQPEPTPEDWARFVTASAAAVKKADPNIRIGVAGKASEQEILKVLIKLPCVDVVGIDCYSVADLDDDRKLADLAIQAHKTVCLRRTWHPDSDKQGWGDIGRIENQDMDVKWMKMMNHFAQSGPFDSVSYLSGPAFFSYQPGRLLDAPFMDASAAALGRKQTTASYTALKEICEQQKGLPVIVNP